MTNLFGIHWYQPWWLVLAPFAPLAAWLIFQGKIGKASPLSLPKILRRWAGTRAVVDRPGARRGLGGFWFGAGLMLAVLALARPQWGNLEETVFDQSREVLLALDLSASMLADDVKPTRLARAKLLIGNLLDELQGERVGLACFAGTAFLQVPLSSDYEVLRDILPGLDPSYLPQAGTDYAGMLRVAAEAFGQGAAADRFLIVLSDGEAHDADWRSALENLKKKDVKIITLGVGTAAGALLPDPQGGVMKDARGAAVLTRLEPTTLEELAQATGGAYREASNWVDLAALLSETIAQGKTGDFAKTREVRQAERYQWFLVPAVFLLAISLALEIPALPGRRRIAMGTTSSGEPLLPPVIKKITKLVAKRRREEVHA
ncbi:MAG: VWA domain-containing protein [Verrucomicrobia bacterium]|nr:VWA domain-containing protein [Verrucomicrobiota bacterium]